MSQLAENDFSNVKTIIPPRLGDAVDEFLSEYRFGDASIQTYRSYRLVLERQLLVALPARRQLAEITSTELRAWVAGQTVATATARWHYTIVGRFFSWCVEQEYLEVSPLAKVKKPKGKESQRVGFTPAELRDLIMYAGKGGGIIPVRDQAICITLHGTAFRAGELLDMTTDRIDRANRLITVVRKGGHERKVRMGRGVASALREWLPVRPKRAGKELWTSQQGGPLTYAGLNAMLRRLGERAGIADVTPHRFRHTAAVAFYNQHHDLVALQRYLGHSDIKVTMTYLRTLGVTYGADLATPDEY